DRARDEKSVAGQFAREVADWQTECIDGKPSCLIEADERSAILNEGFQRTGARIPQTTCILGRNDVRRQTAQDPIRGKTGKNDDVKLRAQISCADIAVA